MRSTRCGRAAQRGRRTARRSPGAAAARYLAIATVTAIAAAGTAGTTATAAGANTRRQGPTALPRRGTVAVVVRAAHGHVADARRAVAAAGGRTLRTLSIVDGVAARVPVHALASLAAARGVTAVTPDAPVHFSAVSPVLGYDAAKDFGSMYNVTRIIGAQDTWKAGYTGKGVDIALLDTGVAPVPGLSSGNVVNGPDLSFDSQDPSRAYVDGYGHGTHMASLIAGRDVPVLRPALYANTLTFNGVAPDARIVNVKVGASDGAADVSQVIAGIDWVVQHRRTDGLNIRVLSLSFGTDSTQAAALDPLAYAAERAWRAGIVVVVAAGNDGSSRVGLADPAMDPLLIAVGATDPNNTVGAGDDVVPDFVTRGTTARHVDLVAPGVHVLGLRSPGSYVDTTYPGSRVGLRFVRGSGTSQATAITSGAAALLLQRYPKASPDMVKRALMRTAVPLAKQSTLVRGNGSVQVYRAVTTPLDKVWSQPTTLDGTGTGSLELARGTAHVVSGDDELAGEQDIFGAPFESPAWAAAASAGTSWTEGNWNGNAWTGSGWTGSSWLLQTWASITWTANAWTGRRWTDADWSGRRWTGDTWSVAAWK